MLDGKTPGTTISEEPWMTWTSPKEMAPTSRESTTGSLPSLVKLDLLEEQPGYSWRSPKTPPPYYWLTKRTVIALAPDRRRMYYLGRS